MQSTNTISFKKFIPGIIWFIVVCFLLFLPGHDIPSVGWLEQINFDKVVHMGIFAVLTVSFCWPFYKSAISTKKKIRYFMIIALLCGIWGYCSELIQKYWAIGRDYELLDWVADSTGAFIAYLFCRKKFI
jgi:hypothetical protein